MTVRRITPYLVADDFDAVRNFYAGFVGLVEGNFGGEHVGFGSAGAQVVFGPPDAEPALPSFGIDVGTPEEVDRLYAEAVNRGLEIVHGPVLEPWGVRRFFARDPNGHVVNVLSHLAPE